jgi:hypothetical protein
LNLRNKFFFILSFYFKFDLFALIFILFNIYNLIIDSYLLFIYIISNLPTHNASAPLTISHNSFVTLACLALL